MTPSAANREILTGDWQGGVSAPVAGARGPVLVRCGSCNEAWLVERTIRGGLPYRWWLCPTPECIGSGRTE